MRYRVPALLLALAAVPLVAAGHRFAQLASGAAPAADHRFADAPLPAALHFVAASVFAVLGAFQFDAELRRRHLQWHRNAGRVAWVAGAAMAASGLWMTLTYNVPLPLQGGILWAARVVVALATMAFLALALQAILVRAVDAHERWMVRAYALALGAGTQVLVLGIPAIFIGDITGATRDWAMTAAWAINATVAEVVIRRATHRSVSAGLPDTRRLRAR